MDTARTLKFMMMGLVFALICNLPFLAWIYNYDWPWAHSFPLGWIGTGLAAFITFFHEVGHTIFGWFYGYVTLPSFDFQHGGGMAWQMTGQLLPLNIGLYAALLYGIYYFQGYLVTQVLLGVIGVFHLATAYIPFHETVINFMGPGAELLIAGFFLYRAWLDLAPRGGVERFLNSFFGFALIVHAAIDGWALLHSQAARIVYYEQKGQHGFGDFDKVADALHVGFEGVVVTYLVLAVVCAVVPLVLYWIERDRV